mmetsp:Transcript_7215/g.10618  ORF Transcript_7215/g.10618 Transcript_7215/m.10618 type:complete len:292 (-) Transcript_7215:1952-2827(-)
MGTVVSRADNNNNNQNPKEGKETNVQNIEENRKATEAQEKKKSEQQQQQTNIKKVKVEFYWPFKAKQVYLVGSWNNWQKQIQLKKGEKNGRINFSVKLSLVQGKHQFKYIVDGKAKINTRLPKEYNNGQEVNVYEFKPSTTTSPRHKKQTQTKNHHHHQHHHHKHPTSRHRARSKPIKYVDWSTFDWGYDEYEFELYKKSPPGMPPHLPHTPLNLVKPPFPASQLAVQALPMHVTLNHVYISEQREEEQEEEQQPKKKETYRQYGMTTRYRDRYITYCYFTPTTIKKNKTS